jgi:hypothetical protein
VFFRAIGPYISLRIANPSGRAELRRAKSKGHKPMDWYAMALAFIPPENVIVNAVCPS